MDLKPELQLQENKDSVYENISETIERELSIELNTESVEGYDDDIDKKDNDFDEDEFKDEDEFE